MPTYEYHCDTCAQNFDVVQSFTDDPLTACPTCGSPVRKVFGNVGIVFKGSGFYKTDSRSGAKSTKLGEAGSDSSADSPSTGSAGPDSNGSTSSDSNGSGGADNNSSTSADSPGSTTPTPSPSSSSAPPTKGSASKPVKTDSKPA